jgi:hypothetical protein
MTPGAAGRPVARPFRGNSVTSVRDRLASLLDAGDVRLGGVRSWDIQVHDESFPARVLAARSAGRLSRAALKRRQKGMSSSKDSATPAASLCAFSG